MKTHSITLSKFMEQYQSAKEKNVASNQDKAKTEYLGTNLDQIPFEALGAIGKVFAEGEKKYGRDNWKKGVDDLPYQRERLNHAIRHLMLYANGDRSEPHLAKVGWFVCTQIYNETFLYNENFKVPNPTQTIQEPEQLGICRG